MPFVLGLSLRGSHAQPSELGRRAKHICSHVERYAKRYGSSVWLLVYEASVGARLEQLPRVQRTDSVRAPSRFTRLRQTWLQHRTHSGTSVSDRGWTRTHAGKSNQQVLTGVVRLQDEVGAQQVWK